MASAARALALACALSLAAGTANAADEWVFCRKSEAAPTAPAYVEVPGDPIFGFTDPSDVGSPGDCGFAMENTGRVGKQRGSYVGIGSKYEFYVTPIENVSLSLSGFSAWEHIRNVPGLDDRTGFAFDGISTEHLAFFGENRIHSGLSSANAGTATNTRTHRASKRMAVSQKEDGNRTSTYHEPA